MWMDKLVLSVENSTHPLNLSANTYKIKINAHIVVKINAHIFVKINAHIVVKNICNPFDLAAIEG